MKKANDRNTALPKEFQTQFSLAKQASVTLALTSTEVKHQTLKTLSELLHTECSTLLKQNALDLEKLDPSDPLYDRLQLTESRIHSMISAIAEVLKLKDPVGQVLEDYYRPNGLHLVKISVPLGVIGMIYESRPNVTLDAFMLCFMAGNSCILKGGKEAEYSNQMLVELIQRALQQHALPKEAVVLLPATREATQYLCQADPYIDVIIPRGGQALIEYVKENTRIPVIETGAGVVHIYFDESGTVNIGKPIITNAKTRRTSVCNALDCLIIHQSQLQNLPELTAELQAKHVDIFADELSYLALQSHYPTTLLHEATPEDFGTEFLDLKLAIKTVASLEEAIVHIRHYTSGHSEGIIAQDKKAINAFFARVDAAVVYANASTAFTDGGEFGMGAEIGISTQKLHVRGPFGMQHLISSKWLIYGEGQVRGG